MAIKFKEANPSNYARGRSSAIQYIVIHYTANDGDTAAGNANYFNKVVTQTSAHYFVDEYADIWQTVRDEDTAWHCGTTGTYKHQFCRNSNSLGVELCSRKDNDGKYYFKGETVDNAAALTKDLMEKYSIPIANVLRHYDVTGKICPAPYVDDENSWLKFLNSLTAKNEASTIRFDMFGQQILDINGFNEDGIVYAAARELLEELGFVVGWDDCTKTALVRRKAIIDATAEEWLIMEKIVEAEAGNEDENGKTLIADVIINRVKSEGFPDTIEEVVFQPGQFGPVWSGAYDRATPTKSTIDAVQNAFNGIDFSQKATFFRTIASAADDCWHEKTLTRLFDYGFHRFYK